MHRIKFHWNFCALCAFCAEGGQRKLDRVCVSCAGGPSGPTEPCARGGGTGEDDGALVVRFENRDRPLLIRKSDGGFLYALDAINGNQRWGFQVDSNNADRLLADPIVRDGLVFVTAMNGEHMVMAYQQDSGQLEQNWRF